MFYVPGLRSTFRERRIRNLIEFMFLDLGSKSRIIRLTLLSSRRPAGVLQRGSLWGGFRPRGDRLHRPGLFRRQSLQADVSLLKHLLDVLQALQGLQDGSLQRERELTVSPLVPRHAGSRVAAPYLEVLGQDDLVLVVQVPQFRQLVLFSGLQEAFDVAQCRLGTFLRLTLVHSLGGQQVNARLAPLVHLYAATTVKTTK